MRIKGSLIAGLLVLSASSAFAAPINAPVPIDATITFDGLQWAWGGPCPYSGGCGDGSLTYQSTQGWALPSAADMAIVDGLDGSVYGGAGSSTFADMFVFAGANVPFDGTDPVSGASDAQVGDPEPGDMACATPYFSTTYLHCDGQDGMAGLWAGSEISVTSEDENFAEQLYVRPAGGGVVGVPEPLTLSLFGAGLAGAAVIRRRKAKRQV